MQIVIIESILEGLIDVGTLERGALASSQLIILMSGFLLGLSLVVPPARHAGQSVWLATFLAIGQAGVYVTIFALFSRRFPGKTFVEAAEMTYGRVLGKLISLLFLSFLFFEASLVVGVISLFLTTTVLVETPLTILLIMLVAVCAWAVNNGIEVLARCAAILVFMAFLELAWTTSSVILGGLEIRNFLPIFDTSISVLAIESHKINSFAISHSVAFLMVIPFVQQQRQVPISMLKALGLGGLALLVTAMRNTAVLGSAESIALFASFEAVRLLDVTHIMARLEILVVLTMITMGFLKASVFLYGTVLGTAQVFEMRTYRPLVLPIAVLVIVFAMTSFTHIIPNVTFIGESYWIVAPFFELAIPLVTCHSPCEKGPR